MWGGTVDDLGCFSYFFTSTVFSAQLLRDVVILSEVKIFSMMPNQESLHYFSSFPECLRTPKFNKGASKTAEK